MVSNTLLLKTRRKDEFIMGISRPSARIGNRLEDGCIGRQSQPTELVGSTKSQFTGMIRLPQGQLFCSEGRVIQIIERLRRIDCP